MPRPRSPLRKGKTMHTKAQMLEDLRAMLKDVFTATARGGAYARVARAHGYVDGFMRALLDTNTVSKSDLLALVAESPPSREAAA